MRRALRVVSGLGARCSELFRFQHANGGDGFTVETIPENYMHVARKGNPVAGDTIADVWSDLDRVGPAAFDQFRDDARAGEAIVESYAGERQSFQVSPATVLLLLRRRPRPQEVSDQLEFPRSLIGTIIPEIDALALDHGLNTAIGRSTVLPMIIRVLRSPLISDDPESVGEGGVLG